MTVNLHDYSLSGKRKPMKEVRDLAGKYAVLEKDEGESCPMPTQVPELNAKNRQRAIDIVGYGKPSEGVTTLCGNCGVFDQTKKMLGCITVGLPMENAMGEDDRGYCGSFQFACSASHTCKAWVEGGPIVDEEEEESEGKIKVEIEIEIEKAADVKVGDFVRWDSNASVAQGKVERVVRDGKINVPNSSFEVKGEQDNPALLIRIYKKFADGWKKTDTLVGHKASTVRSIQPLV
jgi:hypothetical protein